MKKFLSISLLLVLCAAPVSYAQYSDELLSMAQAGDAEAQFNLAVCYVEGNGVEQNYKEAFKWFPKSAE